MYLIHSVVKVTVNQSCVRKLSFSVLKNAGIPVKQYKNYLQKMYIVFFLKIKYLTESVFKSFINYV